MSFLELLGGVVVVLIIFAFALVVFPRTSIMLGIGYYLHQEFDVAFTDINDSLIGVELTAAVVMLVVMIILLVVDLLTVQYRWKRLMDMDMDM